MESGLTHLVRSVYKFNELVNSIGIDVHLSFCFK